MPLGAKSMAKLGSSIRKLGKPVVAAFSWLTRSWVTVKPFRARLMAGAMTWLQGNLP